MNATADKPQPPQAAADNSVVKEIDWQDHRDHLATFDKDGNRTILHPKKPCGSYYNKRTWLSWLLLAVMFTGPFIRIHGNPLLMINIIERRFSILGQIYWPQDSIIFAVAMLCFFMGIVVFTTAFGRLWCGWTCPQTVLMEMVFRKIEYLIDGDGPAQKSLEAAPWTGKKIFKRVFKHAVFFALSFVIGNTLLSYIIGSDQLFDIILDDPRNHLVGLGFMIAFTIVFYLIFARFREQACTFICPYGRFQSAMLDENSMIVAYDHKRGEGRGRLNRKQSWEDRKDEGLGDCVNCNQCVAVCPTGIDIRDGLQMECVNCTACMDACDSIMEKVARPKGLIRYASLNAIEKGEPFRFTGRMQLYAVFLTGLITLFLVLSFTRSDVETTLLRATGGLSYQTQPGLLANLYTLKIANKTSHDIPIEMRVENLQGNITVMGGKELVAPSEGLAETSALIEINPALLNGRRTDLVIGVYSGDKKLETIKTAFIGPRRPKEQGKKP